MFNIEDGNESFTFSPLSNSATKLAYWDEEAYVSELAVSGETKDKSSAPSDSNVKLALDIVAAAAEKEGLAKPGRENEAKAKKRKAEAGAVAKLKKVCFSLW